jgi:hypothetical protein
MLTKKRVGLAGAIVAVIVIALALHATHHTSSPVAESTATPVSDEHGPVRVATREMPRGLHGTSGLEPYPELGTGGLTRDDPVTAYRKANIYPPGSRPLTREHIDLLKPNERHETWRPTEADDGTTFLFTADRFFAFGSDVVTSTLSVKSAKPVTIVQALVGTTDPAFKPVPMTYTQSGDVWTAQLAPSAFKLPAQTELGVFIEFDDGTTKQRAHYNLQYTPDGGVPAQFSGVFADSIVSGSLDLRVGMQVIEPGHYVLDCNLYDASDNPVGWVHWKGDLASGAQNADLEFFGKVIVDANAKGPFHIGQLRGARFDPGHQPDLEQVPPFGGTYATAAYTTNEFSGDEYDSAEKQKMLQFLSQQQQLGVHQAGAVSPPGPTQPGDDH